MASTKSTATAHPFARGLFQPSHRNLVDDTSIEYDSMGQAWELSEVMDLGNEGIRDHGRRFLPQHEAESDALYECRLRMSFLFPGYRDAKRTVSSRPFRMPVTFGENVAPGLVALEPDIDLQGSDLTGFACDLFEVAVHRGLAHVLTEMPSEDDRVVVEGRTAQDDVVENIRPFLSIVDPVNLLAWRTSRVRGKLMLTHARIREIVTEPSGDWGEQQIERVKVYDADENGAMWRLFQRTITEDDQKKDSTFEEVGSGPLSLGEIPLSTVYTNKISHMVSRPMLDDLAWLNLEHWQSASDHRKFLSFIRRAILFGSGMSEDDIERAIIGDRAWFTTTEGAKLQWVEHSGKAWEASLNDVDGLIEKMKSVGLRPFLRDENAERTATESRIDASSNDAPLLKAGRSLELCLSNACWFAGRLLNIPEGFEHDVHLAESFFDEMREPTEDSTEDEESTSRDDADPDNDDERPSGDESEPDDVREE